MGSRLGSQPRRPSLRRDQGFGRGRHDRDQGRSIPALGRRYPLLLIAEHFLVTRGGPSGPPQSFWRNVAGTHRSNFGRILRNCRESGAVAFFIGPPMQASIQRLPDYIAAPAPDAI